MKQDTQQSRQSQEQVQHLRIIRRAQSSHWIPTLHSREPLGPTTRISAIDDIIQHLRMLIERRVHKAQSTFTDLDPLFHDPVDQGCENGSGAGSSSFEDEAAGVEDGEVVAVGGDVGDASAVAVV